MRFKDGIKEKHVIVKTGADKFLPFALVFGIYIVLFGTISPGGGFQGGVIIASAVILLYLGYGWNVVSRAISSEVLRVSESLGAIIYVSLGLLGIFLGANFCRNVLYANGAVGSMVSAGTITFMSWAVGFKVLAGVGFLMLLMVGLLAPAARSAEESTEEKAEESTEESAPEQKAADEAGKEAQA